MMIVFLSSEEFLFFCMFDLLVVVLVVEEIFGFILFVTDSDFGIAVSLGFVVVAVVVVVVMMVDVLVASVDFANRVIGSLIKKLFVKNDCKTLVLVAYILKLDD